ncbi:MAG: tetratricopeptide repeat protein [Hyphomicrobiaceae bacterium]
MGWLAPKLLPILTEKRKLMAAVSNRRAYWTMLPGIGLLALSTFLTLDRAAAAARATFVTPRAALEQGIAAYKIGNTAIALPALEYAKKNQIFPARYYLARIFADANNQLTDHGRAYHLLRSFVSENSQIDPDDYRRAPTFASALTRLARYILDGIPSIGLRPDAHKAVEYFEYAAWFFNDEDAQFELAKLRLTGEGLRRDVPAAKHWLGRLSGKGHAGAQAFLADIYWQGRYAKHRPLRALLLITIALENATDEDAVWIADIHQNIYCGSSTATRAIASGHVEKWRKKFVRGHVPYSGNGLPKLELAPARTCADGQPVRRLRANEVLAEPSVRTSTEHNRKLELQHGNTGGFGYRQAGEGR